MSDLPEVRSYKWTSENVSRFWIQSRKTHLDNSGFAKTAGPRLPALMDEFAPKKNSKILDFGCGGPELPAALTAMGHKVCGYEPALTSDQLSAEGQWPKIVNKLPEGPFDLVIISEVIEHVIDEEIEGVISILKSLLTSSGVLIFTTPYRENLLGGTVLCPNCDTLFHRWQHVRSMTVDMMDDWFPENEGWQKQHVGRYDFSAESEVMTALKRYQRYKPSFKEKFGAILDREYQVDTPKASHEISEMIIAELDRMIFGGTLTDSGFDHSEGHGNILVYVTRKSANLNSSN